MKSAAFFLMLILCMPFCEAQTVGPFKVGYRWGDKAPYGFHPGIDFIISTGTPVVAISGGRVVFFRHTSDDGDEIAIVHGTHFQSNYSHLSRVFVAKDQLVRRGQLIGLSGGSNNYGRLDYQHLHFGVCKTGMGCRDESMTHNPDLFWHGGQPQCFDPQMNYSAYSQKDITLPVACGDYANTLVESGKAMQ